MKVARRGPVPAVWSTATASHLSRRLDALEGALSGGSASYSPPVLPMSQTGAAGVVVIPGAAAAASAATSSVAVSVVSAEGWGRKFLLMGA